MTRLIDKDYLIEEIRCSPVGQLLIRKHNLDGMIEKFPEVDAEPVRHARLINAHPYGECSCCGELIDSRDRFRYCPHCGAMLVGEGIKSVLPDECNNCGEYHDYHCDKFCKIIRETIADLKEYYKDAIPIEDIQYYAEKAENPEIKEALLEVIYRHKAEQACDDVVRDE